MKIKAVETFRKKHIIGYAVTPSEDFAPITFDAHVFTMDGRSGYGPVSFPSRNDNVIEFTSNPEEAMAIFEKIEKGDEDYKGCMLRALDGLFVYQVDRKGKTECFFDEHYIHDIKAFHKDESGITFIDEYGTEYPTTTEDIPTPEEKDAKIIKLFKYERGSGYTFFNIPETKGIYVLDEKVLAEVNKHTHCGDEILFGGKNTVWEDILAQIDDSYSNSMMAVINLDGVEKIINIKQALTPTKLLVSSVGVINVTNINPDSFDEKTMRRVTYIKTKKRIEEERR